MTQDQHISKPRKKFGFIITLTNWISNPNCLWQLQACRWGLDIPQGVGGEGIHAIQGSCVLVCSV